MLPLPPDLTSCLPAFGGCNSTTIHAALFSQVLPTGVTGSPPHGTSHWRTRSGGLASLLRLVGLGLRSLILSASGDFSPSKTPAAKVSYLKRPRCRQDSCPPLPCTSLWAAPGTGSLPDWWPASPEGPWAWRQARPRAWPHTGRSNPTYRALCGEGCVVTMVSSGARRLQQGRARCWLCLCALICEMERDYSTCTGSPWRWSDETGVSASLSRKGLLRPLSAVCSTRWTVDKHPVRAFPCEVSGS